MARVIVVGAGLAGLRAAGRLAAEGSDVLVVEASDRIGGRVATDVVEDGSGLLTDARPLFIS